MFRNFALNWYIGVIRKENLTFEVTSLKDQDKSYQMSCDLALFAILCEIRILQ